MRIAYADPPYMGCADKYPEKQEVDHAELINKLSEYDGWALSASSPSIFDIVPLFNGCRPRMGVWVKPFCSFKPNVNPAYAWGPVFFMPARKKTRKEPTTRDWVSVNITLKKGLVGAKPPDFCFWLFEILNMRPEDEFIDLFPGTGIVTECWEIWKKNKTWL